MQSNETGSCRIYATGARVCHRHGLVGGAQQQASRPSLTDQGWWIVSTARGPACLVRLMVVRACNAPGMLIDVLPSYLCACMLTLGTCHVFPQKRDGGVTTWERLRVHLAPGECDSRQGWEGSREIRGRQPTFSIKPSWQRPGWERGESSPEVPGRITVIPAGIQWPAKVAGQYGLGVLFFRSNTHNSTSIPSRVHGVHSMAWDGGRRYIRDLYPLAGPSCKHSRSNLHMPCWAHTRSHKGGGDLFLFSPASKGPGNTR